MPNIDIRRPRTGDVEELHRFFRTVITDTFIKEGIGHLLQDMENEIETKKTYLERDLGSDGVKRYFLLALLDGEIIGSIEYGPASELISKCTNNEMKNLNEVGTVFVLSDYQAKGVGNMLLNEMYRTLRDRGMEEFCLDSGYTKAQKIWKKKFGEPNYLLEDYWGEGYPQMIWRIQLADLL